MFSVTRIKWIEKRHELEPLVRAVPRSLQSHYLPATDQETCIVKR